MINKIKSLLNKTSDLENKLSTYEKKNSEETNNCLTISKSLNHSCISKTKILITNLEVIKGKTLYFQNLIELNNFSKQKIIFSILVDDILIHKSTRSLESGFNQITLIKNYTPLITKEVKIEIEITPLESKQIVITNTTLLVWGIANNVPEISYQTLETNNYYLITYFESNIIKYKFINKEISTFNYEDFSTFKSALSFSFCKHLEDIFLFRVDQNKNLFISNFKDKNESFLLTNIDYVSSASNSESIIVSVIKNKECFYFEYTSDGLSQLQKLPCLNIPLNKCLCFYNEFSKKFYVIMNSTSGGNFIAESLIENTKLFENISAKYSISIQLKEGQ